MTKKDRHQTDLMELFDAWVQTRDDKPLRDYLTSHSELPGRRANLELARAFGDVAESYAAREQDGLWELVLSLSRIPPDEAPVNAPEEFLPFCGAIGVGALGSISAERIGVALQTLKTLSNDPRWRMREAVCFGLQRMLARRRQDVLPALETWIGDGSCLELRAVAATVAEPALLQAEAFAHAALRLHGKILERVLDTTARKCEEFKTLRKALGYTLSVVVHAAPQAGFEFLARCATSQDADVRWIVRQNLKKKRLVKHFPQQVESTSKLLG